MTRLRSFILCAGLGFGACESPRTEAEAAVRRVGAPRLRQEAATYYKNLQAVSRPAFMTLRMSDCPPSFQALAPLHAGAYRDGFSLAKVRTAEVEEGYYIVPLGMDIVPPEKPRAHFIPLAEGVYWYIFRL